MHYIREVEKRKKKVKRRQNKCQHSGFPLHNIFQPCMCIQNFKTVALIRAEKFLTKTFFGEKEKWTNKGNEKHEDADFLLHDTTCHTQCLYQISKS